MKNILPKLCFIFAIIFSFHATTALACLKCKSSYTNRIEKKVVMHCHEQSQSQNDKTAPHKKCCCYDTPIKNIEHFKISYSFDHSLNPIAYLDIPIMLKKYHVGPVLNYSQKRYRPFGLYSDDNILSLKQSFLI